jgi:hypothetical protein
MENKFIVIENVLKKENFLTIKNTMEGDTFPWYFNKVLYNEVDNNFQFTHIFYNNFTVNSDFYGLIIPIIDVLKPLALIKIKANLLTKEKNIIEHGMHVDYDYKNCKTAVYYVNTNNGYTKFSDGAKISSEENKLLIFNTEEKHTGTTCTDSSRRIVINFNYVPNEL